MIAQVGGTRIWKRYRLVLARKERITTHHTCTGSSGVLVAQLVLRHSCVADRLPVVVRFPAGPRVSLKSGDQPKGRWRRPKKKTRVQAALESNTRAHTLTTSGFFPCSIDREYLYGYATDGHRSPLWLCAAYNGSPALVHARSGYKIFFHAGIQDRQLVVIPGIHYFDAHRLNSELVSALERQIDPRSMKFVGTEGANDP